MQRAELVLAILREKTRKNPDYKFERLYRVLYNKEFYYLAYKKIYGLEADLTEDTNRNITNGLSNEIVNKIVEDIRTERYNPCCISKMYKRVEQKKTTNQRDMLVQEVIGCILKAIYEPSVNCSAHYNRPYGDIKKTMYQIQQTCQGARYGIKGSFKMIPIDVFQKGLIDCFKEQIVDERFINLIMKFMKAGYIASGNGYDPKSGVNRGNIIGPIVKSIYYNRVDSSIKKTILAEKSRDDNRFKYIRNGQDFIIFIWTNMESMKDAKIKIGEALSNALIPNAIIDEMIIKNLEHKGIEFLGYQIQTGANKGIYDHASEIRKNMKNTTIRIMIPERVITERLRLFTRNGKPIANDSRINLSIQKIIGLYNNEIKDLYDYYSITNNGDRKLRKFRYFHYHSLLKTIAKKEKCSVKTVIKKYGMYINQKESMGRRKTIGVEIDTKIGKQVLTYFNGTL